MCFLFVLLLCLILVFGPVEAFTARLNRPWNENSLTRRRQTVSFIQVYVSKLERSKSESNENQDEDDDNDDAVSLEEPLSHNLSSDVTLAEKTASTSSAKTESQVPTNNGHPVSRSQQKQFSDSTVSSASKQATVQSCLPDLYAMMRPSNLPGVVLFHMLGIHLAVKASGMAFWKLLVCPSMMVTLLALLLTSSTSMLVNDYYDYKLDHDSDKLDKPLASEKVPLRVVKRFLSYLYAAALVCMAFIPGAPARLAVVNGLMLTFWYTQHLKPKTWLKNTVCASLIALSPLASGVAAMAYTQIPSSGVTPLLRVVSMLFVGILGREMTMDINDVQDDMKHGVRTVPVVYGRKFASTIGLICSLGVAGLALSGPIVELVGGSTGKGVLRRLILASFGSLAQIGRASQVFRTEGQDSAIVSRAVDEGLLSVVLLLASFV